MSRLLAYLEGLRFRSSTGSGRKGSAFAGARCLSLVTQALACARQIKGWSRATKLAMIRGNWHDVSHLARSQSAQGGNMHTVLPQSETAFAHQRH